MGLAAPAAALARPGDPDPSFAGDGVADIGGDDAWGLAIQADGRIAVAGDQFCGEFGREAGAARLLADGTLDPTFGSGGIACHDSGYYIYEEAWDAALQPDGKLVLAGHWSDASRGHDHRLVRLLPDGSLDPSFGAGGRASANVTGFRDMAFGVALQADGKIVVAGYGGSTNDPLVARYNPDGTLDASFGSAGAVQTAVDGVFTDVVIQPDGKIVAVGSQSGGGQSLLAVRLLPSGVQDQSFGSGGIATVETAGERYGGAGVALQPDGKILVAGSDQHPAGGRAFAAYRLSADGRPDSSFGVGGVAVTRLGTSAQGYNDYDAHAESLVVQQNGKVVVGGNARFHSDSGYYRLPALVRYTPEGQLDTGFGDGGKVFGPLDFGGFNVLALQADGKIVGAGHLRVARFQGDPAPGGAPAALPPSGSTPEGGDPEDGAAVLPGAGSTSDGGEAGDASPVAAGPGSTSVNGDTRTGSIDAAAPRVALRLRRQGLRAALRRGYVATASSSEPGAVFLDVYTTGGAARAVGGRKAKRVRVARGVKAVATGGKVRVVAKFSRKARSKLRRRRNLVLTVRLTVRDNAGNTSRAAKRTRLRR